MPPPSAIDHVCAARKNVSQAIHACGRADEAGLLRAIGFLETSVAYLRQAEAEIRASLPPDRAKLRCEALLLKRQVAIMMRVIDGGAALRRGLSVRLGSTAPGYTPQGRLAPRPAPAAVSEMQG
jgi:hypothetical protein